MLNTFGYFLIDLDHKIWTKIIYPFREWKCSHFGHRAYLEEGAGPSHTACKRGCGPI